MDILRKIYYSVGAKGRLLLRKIIYAPIDLYDGITGKRDDMTPKRGDIYIGSGDFKAQGKAILSMLIEHGGLKQTDDVLDIGSGIGRVAVALTSYLKPESKYCGFDVVEKGVNWCKEHITTKFPNFDFKYISLKNDLYNQSTEAEASKFKFPYEDNSFDFAFLTSVFTHMLPADVENYMNEISRVLRNGGTCASTFFMVDDKVTAQMKEKKTAFDFSTPYKDKNDDECLLLSVQVKEANVAFDYSMIEKYATNAGLKIEKYIYGKWTKIDGSENAPNFQDLVVFRKG